MSLNTQAFRKAIMDDLERRPPPKELFEEAKIRFEEIKQEALNKFDEHEVTRELQEGYEAANAGSFQEDSSNLLGGVNGNLYSFIGFNQGDDVVKTVRDELERDIRFTNVPRTTSKGLRLNYIFNVFIPTFKQLERVTPMPFGTKSSWIEAIETYIPSLNAYIYWKATDDSRSTIATLAKVGHVKGGPIQSLRSAEYAGTPYISEILDYLKEEFSG